MSRPDSRHLVRTYAIAIGSIALWLISEREARGVSPPNTSSAARKTPTKNRGERVLASVDFLFEFVTGRGKQTVQQRSFRRDAETST